MGIFYLVGWLIGLAFSDEVSMCSLGCPGTCPVDQAMPQPHGDPLDSARIKGVPDLHVCLCTILEPSDARKGHWIP